MTHRHSRWILPAGLALLCAGVAACSGDEDLPIVTFDTTDPGQPDDVATQDPGIDPGRDNNVPHDPGHPPTDTAVDPGQDPGQDPGSPNDPGTPPTDTGADVPQCKDSSTCSLGNICFGGQCVPGCGSDRDCPESRYCKPDALPHGFCLQCLTNDHCNVAAHETCIAGTCLSTCSTDNDCKAKVDTPYCDQGTGLCVQCMSDGVCPIGTLCVGSKCVSGCRSDRDCPDSLKCDAKAGANGGCFTCVQNADCNGKICKEHQCVIDCSAVNCTAPKPVCNPATGGCVACLVKADCPAGNLCLGSQCIAGCETDGDCSGGRKCNNGTCVQCVTDGQCPQNQKCLQNQCLSAQCVKDTDCGSGRYCHPLLMSCETLPPSYCVSDSDCPAGYPPILPAEVCDPLTRTCIPACFDLGGLPLCLDITGSSQRSVCVDGGCYFCGSDNDCAGTRCDPYDRQCLVCEGDADCAVPTWHCDGSTGGCRECLNDTQCAFPLVCDEANGYRCVECLVDGDCKSPAKPICGKSKTCIAQCSNQCTTNQKICNPDDTAAPIGYLTCDDYDDDPCMEYGGPTECGTGASCVTQANGQGSCVCQNECTSGQKRCVAGEIDAYETCAQNSSSGCWYWSTSYCGGYGEVCSGGSCACGNICTLGARACDKNNAAQTLVCDDYDPYNVYADCPYWQYSTTCPSGYVCTGAGVCARP